MSHKAPKCFDCNSPIRDGWCDACAAERCNGCGDWCAGDKAVICKLRDRVAELEDAQTRHLALIAELTRSAIDEAEAEEMRARIAALIAEVGTLRAALRGQELGKECE